MPIDAFYSQKPTFRYIRCSNTATHQWTYKLSSSLGDGGFHSTQSFVGWFLQQGLYNYVPQAPVFGRATVLGGGTATMVGGSPGMAPVVTVPPPFINVMGYGMSENMPPAATRMTPLPAVVPSMGGVSPMAFIPQQLLPQPLQQPQLKPQPLQEL